MKRYLKKHLINDLATKVVLLMGPRQSGKTTLSKDLISSYDYLNYDSSDDRVVLREKSWDRKKDLVIFDEIHKMNNWKQWIKGVYDTEGIPPQMLVTGSARLDVHRKVGDSLAGRYFQYRLHPLDMKELSTISDLNLDDLFEQLSTCSGFPEPFIKNSKTFYRRWKKTHTDIILRQDLLDTQSVKDIKAIEILVDLLKKRVGSSISYANLARDIEVDPNTVKRYLQILENLYVVFKVTPYSKNIARSLLKEPKYYFYDYAHIDNDEGAKLENIVASALIKELDYIEDIHGYSTKLYYLRTKEGKELDFLVLIDNKPTYLIEVKQSDDTPAKSFHHFSSFLEGGYKIQLVKNLSREKTFPSGLEIRTLIPWLANLNLLKENQ